MKYNKKGISAIVATVLIILITVAAVTIIWAAIIPMINQQIGDSQKCMDAISQVSLKTSGYTCKNETAKTISIQIAHGAKTLDLVDVQILLSSGGNTETVMLSELDMFTQFNPKTNLPGPNEEKTYLLNRTAGDFEADIATIDKVEIAPVVGVGATQSICDGTTEITLMKC